MLSCSDAVTVTTCCYSYSEAPAGVHMTSIVWFCVGIQQLLIARAWQDKRTQYTCAALFAWKHNRTHDATCRPHSTLTTQSAALGCMGCSLRSYGVSVIQRLCTYGSGWQPVMKNPQVSTYCCFSTCSKIVYKYPSPPSCSTASCHLVKQAM